MNMSKETKQKFEIILSDYFTETLSAHPLWANSLGMRQGEGKLGETGVRFVRRDEKRRQKALLELDKIAAHQLSSDQQLDRLAWRSMLLTECEDFKRGVHTMDPSAVDDLFEILLHELQRGEDEPVRAKRNIRLLLRDAPQYLKQSSKMIDCPEKVWRKIMQQTVSGAGALFDAVEVFMGAEGLKLTKPVRRAVKQYESDIMAKKLAPKNSFALGAKGLQRRVHDELGLDYSLDQIEAIALSEADRVGGMLGSLCGKYGKGKPAEAVIEKARSKWNPPGELLEYYQDETDRVARVFKAAKAVGFPEGDELQVRLVPEFMRHLYPTAAYCSPGPFEKRQRGIFWVNDLSLCKASQADKQAEVQQHFGVSLTCAHEAYPGHHLQFVTANTHKRKWRPLFAHAIFYEGWTLWCEQMMVDLKVDSSRWTKIIQLHDALWRVHRILVDLRLHTGRYTYEEGVRHLQKYVGFTKARAEADVNWYTSSPGVPMSYWLGRLENARLHKRLVEGRGWSLKRFNNWLLSHGTLPQSWLEKYMLD